MPTRLNFGRMEFDISLGSPAARISRDPETPFCLAVLGDFSGRGNRKVLEPVVQRRPVLVDCDNFGEAMARLGAELRLPHPQRPQEALGIRFAGLEDFHPDELLKRVAPWAQARDLRGQLLDPATSAGAATELQSLLGQNAGTAPVNPPAAAAGGESDQEALSRLLGNAPQPTASPRPPSSGVDISNLIRSIVAPSAGPNPHPQQTALLSALDLETGAQLRAMLHHPDFQALEAAWRSLDLLVRNLEASETLKIYLIDASKEELAADLRAQDDLHLTGASQLILKPASHVPWAMVVANYTFGNSLEDVEMLGRLARISAPGGAPFLAGASPHLVGCESFGTRPDPDDWTRSVSTECSQAWQALRELPEAASIGLALPRFLLRQPYGKESEPIDSFPFEELPAPHAHETFLWGNAAFVCAYIFAEAFLAEGWEMNPTGYGEITGLPVFKFQEDGENQVKPGAEAWLSDRAADRILSRGLIPLLSIKGRNAARLASLQSLATPPKLLLIRGVE